MWTSCCILKQDMRGISMILFNLEKAEWIWTQISSVITRFTVALRFYLPLSLPAPEGFLGKWAFSACTAFLMSHLNTEVQVLHPHFRTGYTHPPRSAVACWALEHDIGFVWLSYCTDKPCDSFALQDTLRTFAKEFPLRVTFWALSHPIPAKEIKQHNADR